jgi:hypothetical protein
LPIFDSSTIVPNYSEIPGAGDVAVPQTDWMARTDRRGCSESCLVSAMPAIAAKAVADACASLMLVEGGICDVARLIRHLLLRLNTSMVPVIFTPANHG